LFLIAHLAPALPRAAWPVPPVEPKLSRSLFVDHADIRFCARHQALEVILHHIM
jgi:hypothetical protein